MKDVKTKTLEDRMESFVLSETFKYLYLVRNFLQLYAFGCLIFIVTVFF